MGGLRFWVPSCVQHSAFHIVHSKSYTLIKLKATRLAYRKGVRHLQRLLFPHVRRWPLIRSRKLTSVALVNRMMPVDYPVKRKCYNGAGGTLCSLRKKEIKKRKRKGVLVLSVGEGCFITYESSCQMQNKGESRLAGNVIYMSNASSGLKRTLRVKFKILSFRGQSSWWTNGHTS